MRNGMDTLPEHLSRRLCGQLSPGTLTEAIAYATARQ
jgi:hypothetical protein